MSRIPFVFICLAAMITTASVISCNKKDIEPAVDPLANLDIPASPFNYSNPALPAFFNAPGITGQDNTPANNRITDWGATLGRVIFYDKIVSINKSISCGSCHNQSAGFSDNNALSLGFNGGVTGRNSMSIINARYYPNGRFFWDERAATLEEQVLMPVQDHIEMGMRLDTLVNRFNATTYYPVLFEKAFGNRSITSEKIAAALAQFVRSVVSYQSKFDAGRAAIIPPQNPVVTPYPNFTAQENLGKQLFFSPQTNCATCHGTEVFTAPGPRNNGIENPAIDLGVGGANGIANLNGHFKVPTLKNIAQTAPYMHDGRFATLAQVIEHYNSGVQPHPNLSPQLRNPDGTPRRLNLTNDEKQALIAFLHTLTDNAITTDPKFANPFR